MQICRKDTTEMEYKIEENVQRCLECGNTLEYGRKGRKFCDDSCKNAYHNKRNHDLRSLHARIMGAINRNYEVLDRLILLKISAMDIGDAVLMGFNPDYSTGHRKSRGHEEYRCYEIKYYLSSSRIFNITRSPG